MLQTRKLSPRALALWLKSQTAESPSGCWEWTAGKHGVGYGSISRTLGGGGYAHRAMYQSVIGPIPDGMYVLHDCDNRLCINPEHLFPGTHLDNIKDMHAKNRQRGGSMPNEKNPSCKFSDETIRQIRGVRATGLSLSKIVRQFGISETHLLKVLKGEKRRGI